MPEQLWECGRVSLWTCPDSSQNPPVIGSTIFGLFRKIFGVISFQELGIPGCRAGASIPRKSALTDAAQF